MTDEDEIAAVVREHGWYAASIYDHDPPFLFTIGLMQSWNHPELITFGLESQIAHPILSAMVRDIRAGTFFREPGTFLGVLADHYRIGIRRVHPTQHQLYLGYAMGYCRYLGRIGELEAVQVFWPDKAGKFSFEVGCDLEVFRCQPRLDLPLTPSEIAEFQRQWR
jgi:hypothetical protein